IKLDSEFVSAYAMAAECFDKRKVAGWFTNPSWTTDEVNDLVRRAIELAGNDALSLGRAGHILGYVVGDLEGGIAIVEKALRLNPNLTVLWVHLSFLRIFEGRHDLAFKHAEQAMRIGPNDPYIYDARLAGALALFFLERYDDGRRLAEIALR